MSIRNLEHLFRPQSVAVIGASETPRSVGATVLHNLIEGKFAGTILPVNPKYRELAGIKVYPTVASLPDGTGARRHLYATRDCAGSDRRARRARHQGRHRDHGRARDDQGRTRQELEGGHACRCQASSACAILGPNCVGLLVPGLGLNASFAHTGALPGKIAFVSQSGALVTAVLDWAKSRGIGFSKFISLGDSADVDCGDVLDYLGSDPETHAILLYIEAITAARKFMSAARAAARNKPVLVVKAGRAAEGRQGGGFSHRRAGRLG